MIDWSTMPDQPTALGDRARDNLSFIRNTMERATAFTGVPGWGGAGMGATAIVASGLAADAPSTQAWLTIWLTEAVVAFLIGAWSLGRKSRRLQGSVLARPARQFLLSFSPPILVGVALTVALWASGNWELLPGTWLLLYGAGVVTGGAFSVRAVPSMGLVITCVGVVTLFWPGMGDIGMATGFGVVQIGFGAYIARRHGG